MVLKPLAWTPTRPPPSRPPPPKVGAFLIYALYPSLSGDNRGFSPPFCFHHQRGFSFPSGSGKQNQTNELTGVGVGDGDGVKGGHETWSLRTKENSPRFSWSQKWLPTTQQSPSKQSTQKMVAKFQSGIRVPICTTCDLFADHSCQTEHIHVQNKNETASGTAFTWDTKTMRPKMVMLWINKNTTIIQIVWTNYTVYKGPVHFLND